jgi:tRNA dimethylallyltransferase
MSARPLVAVAGPTGSGKSELALRICEVFGGEVINCDSLQVYRYFDIGTAKLPPAERRGIPHHLIDIAEPDELFTAGEYAVRAREKLREVSGRALPVVAGGTGFYLRALLDGLFPAPPRDEELRARLSAARPGALRRLLRRVDPAAARSIHPNDTPKTMRALEVYFLTKRPISSWFGAGRDALEGFRVLKIGLDPPRAALYERIDRRCERMFREGLVEETRGILDRGYPPSAKPLESLGYAQAMQVLSGKLVEAEAIREAQTQTRRYAKRQMTWFRKEPGLHWLAGFGQEPAIQDAAIALVLQSGILPEKLLLRL